MPTLFYNGQSFTCDENETVLDALLRQEQNIPHGCKAGACQSCLMKLSQPDIALPAAAQVGLKASQKSLGYFLSCCCTPQSDLTLERGTEGTTQVSAKLINKLLLSPTILQLQLEAPLAFQAGQYINIWLDNTHVRSYSIASLPSENLLELHVKLIDGGKFSQMAKTELQPGDTLTLQGPMGDCIYATDTPTEPLLLVGIGTGLAPLLGIIKDALAQNHTGDIHLVLGAKTSDGFYHQQNLIALSRQHANLQVHFIAQTVYPTETALPGLIEGDLYQWVKAQHPNTQGYRVFLCGAESFVRKMKKQCFLTGTAMNQIHADAFLPCTY